MKALLIFISLLALTASAQNPFANPAQVGGWQPFVSSGGSSSTMSDQLVFVVRGFTNDTVGRTSYLTAPATDYIQSNTLALVEIVNTLATTPTTPTISGMGINWVQIGTTNYNTLTVPTQRTTVFRGMTNGLATGRITADFGGVTQTSCLIQLMQAFGAGTNGTDGAGGLVQTNFGGGNADTTLTITLGAFNANGTNGGLGFYGNNLNPFGGSPEAGWTEGSDFGVATPNTGLGIYWRVGTTDNTIAPSSASAAWGGIGYEVAANLITAIPPPKPDLWWNRFVDGGGTYNTPHVGPVGTATGTWVDGPSAGTHGMTFNGSTQVGGTVSTLAYGTNIITVFLRMKFAATNATQVTLENDVSYSTSTGNWAIYLQNNGTLNFAMSGTTSGTLVAALTSLNTGAWHDYLAVYSMAAGTITIYVDGVIQSPSNTGSTVGTGNFATHTVFYGARNNASLFYNGTLSDIEIFTGDQSASVSNLHTYAR